MKKITIAIDGYSSCGKSTLAKQLARELGYLYIDTGAMYRAVCLYFLQNDLDWNDPEVVTETLPKIDIHFEYEEDGSIATYLNGRNVEAQIRSQMVAQSVSEVSTIREIRQFLVAQQQKLGRDKGVVMDGRDIGTVVFPDAELKLFVTADIDTRTDRRYKELQERGTAISREAVRENLEHRDNIDTQREESPLYRAPDAKLIENTLLTRETQLKLVLNYARGLIDGI